MIESRLEFNVSIERHNRDDELVQIEHVKREASGPTHFEVEPHDLYNLNKPKKLEKIAKVQQQKCVTFSNNINIHYDLFPAELRKDLHWSKNEIRDMMTNASTSAEDAAIYFCKEIVALEEFYESGDRSKDDQDGLEVMRKWSESSYRGIENWCSRKFHEEQTQVVKALVTYHVSLRESSLVGNRNLNIDKLMQLRSARLSEGSRIFAFKMGLADSL